jgi:hypothetical protein
MQEDEPMNDAPLALVTVTGAQPLGGYKPRLLFSDGAVGDVDLAEYLRGPVFEALRDPVAFERVRVDHRRGTIVWPNGADLAPDLLRATAVVAAPPAAATA